MKAKVWILRLAALVAALLMAALWVFMPRQLDTVWKDENNSGRKKATLNAGESLTWDWTPHGDTRELTFRITGTKNAENLTLRAEVLDGQGKTMAEKTCAFKEEGEDNALILAGSFTGGTPYTLKVSAGGEGSIKFRGDETEEGFRPDLTETGSETKRNATLPWLVGGFLLMALLPVKGAGRAEKRRKNKGVAAVLPRVCLITVLAGGFVMIFTRTNPLITGKYCAWDEVVHWEEGIRALMIREDGTLTFAPDVISNWTLGYLPLVLGTLVGSMFTGNEEILFQIATGFGLVTYGILGALAVKTAPKYKAAFLATAVMPGCVFLATRASYDAMVIGSALLGLAMLLRVWEEDKPSGALIFTMTALLALGTAAKPIYTLLMIPLLTIPGEKLGGKTRGWIYRAFVLALIAWSLASLLLPGVYDTVRNGDSRFEDTVQDSAGQMRYLWSRPWEWITIPVGFLWGNLRVLFIGSLCARDTGSRMAVGWILAAVLLLLAPMAVTGEEKPLTGLTASRRLLLGGSALLILAALTLTQYIVSTPVGAAGVQGMQPRYTLPVWIACALALALPRKLRAMANNRAGDVLALAIGAGCFGVNLWIALAGVA